MQRSVLHADLQVLVKLLEGDDNEMCTLSMELVNDVLDPMEQVAD